MFDYPRIKCNVGRDSYGFKTKIYHLPFDQQYDNVIIEPQKGECFAFTVEEAENKGFRRAYTWHGKAQNTKKYYESVSGHAPAVSLADILGGNMVFSLP